MHLKADDRHSARGDHKVVCHVLPRSMAQVFVSLEVLSLALVKFKFFYGGCTLYLVGNLCHLRVMRCLFPSSFPVPVFVLGSVIHLR